MNIGIIGIGNLGLSLLNFLSEQKHEIYVSDVDGDNVDVLFIDGDHQYDGVIKDFNNYKDFVVKGGYIIFDDYQDYIHSPEVKKAVDDLVGGLNVLEYEILGSIEYDLISKTNVPELSSSNEFILKKLY
jgi:homoserine dehydrogenase